jgi:hypothetical protein
MEITFNTTKKEEEVLAELENSTHGSMNITEEIAYIQAMALCEISRQLYIQNMLRWENRT